MILKRLLKQARNIIKLELQKDRYLKLNKHNFTEMGNYFPLDVVKVGRCSYGTINAHYYKTAGEGLSIGAFCSIANDVHFFLGGGHDYHNLLTFPSKNYISHDAIAESITKGPISVGDDVWIGYGSVILSGVTIGQGAVIGARSIVTKDVPPYAIWAGTRVIGYRFDTNTINRLSSFDVANLTLEEIKKHLSCFYTPVTSKNIANLLCTLEGNQENE